MSDADRYRSSSWTVGDKMLPLALLAAAGVGYLVWSRGNGQRPADRVAGRRRALRTGGRKIRTEEPMAGYGR